MKDSKSIRLSPRHGLNPTMLVCPVCQGDSGIGLPGYIKGDQQAPRYSLDRQPCQSCQARFDEGYLAFIRTDVDDAKVADEKLSMQEVRKHATGEVLWIKARVANTVFNVPLSQVNAMSPEAFDILKERFAAYITHEVGGEEVGGEEVSDEGGVQ